MELKTRLKQEEPASCCSSVPRWLAPCAGGEQKALANRRRANETVRVGNKSYGKDDDGPAKGIWKGLMMILHRPQSGSEYSWALLYSEQKG